MTNSISKIIHANRVNAKFWFTQWSKNHCAEIKSKIAHAIEVLKELINKLFMEGVRDAEERATLAAVNKEINEISALIA